RPAMVLPSGCKLRRAQSSPGPALPTTSHRWRCDACSAAAHAPVHRAAAAPPATLVHGPGRMVASLLPRLTVERRRFCFLLSVLVDRLKADRRAPPARSVAPVGHRHSESWSAVLHAAARSHSDSAQGLHYPNLLLTESPTVRCRTDFPARTGPGTTIVVAHTTAPPAYPDCAAQSPVRYPSLP